MRLHQLSLLTAEVLDATCSPAALHCRVLKRSDGGGLALSNFAKKQPVVLFFYPRKCNQEHMMCQQARPLLQQCSRLQRDQPS